VVLRQLLIAGLIACVGPVAALAQAPSTEPAHAPPTVAPITLSLLAQALRTPPVQEPKPAPSPTQVPGVQPGADKTSHWGVSGSFTPKWELWSVVKKKLLDNPDDVVNLSGSQFSIGIVRGRSSGGEWGVSFVSQSVKDGSGASSVSHECPPGPTSQCFDLPSSFATQNAKLFGAELHFFIPFATIKRRVLVGLKLAAGAGMIAGNAVTTDSTLEFVPNPQPQPGGTFKATTKVTTKAIKDELGLPVLPMLSIGAAVAFIVTPAVKVRWEGGIVAPGVTTFAVTVTYLIGAH
jgi:hypothetical protein